MAQHLLDTAQIHPVGQQVTGEGVAQYMRTDLARIDSDGDGECLQQLAETLAGEVTANAARGQQPA